MGYTIAVGRHNKYYKYGVYNDLETAMRTAKYFRRKSKRLRYKITEERTESGKKIFGLWLTNYVRW